MLIWLLCARSDRRRRADFGGLVEICDDDGQGRQDSIYRPLVARHVAVPCLPAQ